MCGRSAPRSVETMRRIAVLATGLAACLACGALAVAAPAGAEFAVSGTFGAPGTGPAQFDNPIGVAVGEDGAVWVADGLNDRVQEWTAGGAFVRAFGSTGTGRGHFRLPEDVLQVGGHLYVSDCDNGRVARFDRTSLAPTGEFTGDALRLRCPEGLAAGAAGDIWVADTFNDRLVDYDPATNTVVRVVGGVGNPLLRRPRDVARSPLTGELYVSQGEPTTCADANVRRLAADGTLLGSFAGSGAGAIRCPNGVSVDAVGNVFASGVSGVVNAYGPDGTYVRTLSSSGGAAFSFPIALASDAACGLYVVERNAARVAHLAWSEPPACRVMTPPAAAVKPKPVPVTGPAFQATWPKVATLTSTGVVRVKVRCPFESCRIVGFGKVRRSATAKPAWTLQIVRPLQLRTRTTGTLTLHFRLRRDLGAIRALVRRGGHPTAELVVSASDAKGHATRRRHVVAIR